MTPLVPRVREPEGPLLTTPDHVDPALKFFTTFNPSSIAPTFRDILRYLFRTSAPDSVKYSEEHGSSHIDIRVTDDQAPDHAPGAKPVILIGRGDYQVSPVSLTDNAASFGVSEHGQQDRTMYLSMVNGAVSIRIITWNFGTCELLGNLVMKYLTASKPYICNSQGFKNLGPLMVSRPLRDKDEKDKWVIDLQQPYTLEMKWVAQNIGPQLKGILTSLVEQSQ